MKSITEDLLKIVSDWKGVPAGAYHIREDLGCAGIRSTEHIKVAEKTDKPGIDVRVAPGTKDEKVFIPACVTHSGIDDVVYNDFYIGEGADVTIVAGCGVHSAGEEEAKHNGIHRFFIAKGARVLYLEKHIGTGGGTGARIINPQTWAQLDEGAYMEMNTTQIGGVDTTIRKTEAHLSKDAKLIIHEKILTDGGQAAESDFLVTMDGENCGTHLISRSVAKGHSSQLFRSRLIGNTVCSGHSECDAIIMDKGKVIAEPQLTANSLDAALIHEAAIGKIAGEQITKLRTLGLTEKEAEEKIIEGFLR